MRRHGSATSSTCGTERLTRSPIPQRCEGEPPARLSRRDAVGSDRHGGVDAWRASLSSSGHRRPLRSRAAALPGPFVAGTPVGRWIDQAPGRQSRGEGSAATTVGNLAGSGAPTSNGAEHGGRERLDLRSGKWSRSATFPSPLNHVSAVGYRGELYVGGYSQSSDASAGAVAVFWRFDPAFGRWSRRAAHH